MIPSKSLRLLAALIVLTTFFAAPAAEAQRLMEKLDRGVVGIRQSNGDCFVSWRLLGTDPEKIAFNVYRASAVGSPVKLNSEPLDGPTFYIDKSFKANEGAEYFVRPVIGGAEQAPSKKFRVPKDAPTGYLSVPLKTPEGYTPNDASVGDLDGDGSYEIVLHQTGRAHDNSHAGETDPPILQAYKLDGTMLWEINLGKNIREGAHYTQFMVYDLDGDGRAEVACKTADGTVDGKGKVIGDAKANHVSENGYILSGPEFLTVFDGLTGAELATTDYIPPRHPRTEKPTSDQLKETWGDGYGNRVDRFLACVAYLDGERPSLVMCRGYYTRTVLAAWDWRDGQLTKRWVFDSGDGPAKNRKYAGQGNHGLSVADVDGDGKDEIVYGGMSVDDDGSGLWTSGLGHGDAMHVSDLDPERPGLEIFRIQEPVADAGAHMFDAATGEVLWKKPTKQGSKEGPGRGVAFDIDPRHKGMESWVAGGGIDGLFDVKGNKISEARPGPVNFGIWWDGDLLRELLDRTFISKWDWKNSTEERLLTGEDVSSNNGTKATPCLSGDILGDWREEVIWRTSEGNELRIYSTTIPTEYRFFTLMHDPQYRLSIAWQNVSYNQPPHTSFYLGDGMEMPPRPKITTDATAVPSEAAPGEESPGEKEPEPVDQKTLTRLKQLVAQRDARAAFRDKITQLNKQPRMLLVVKPKGGRAEIVRAQNASVEGDLVVADMGEGKRGVWQSDVVAARLPWFTEEELKSGVLDLPDLIGQYEEVASANAEVETALAPDITKFKELERERQEARAALERRLEEIAFDESKAYSETEIRAAITEGELLQLEMPEQEAEISRRIEPFRGALKQLAAGNSFVDGQWVAPDELALRKLREEFSQRPVQALVATQSELVRALALPALIGLAILLVALLLIWRSSSRTFGIVVLAIWGGALFLFVRAWGGGDAGSPPFRSDPDGDAGKVLRILAFTGNSPAALAPEEASQTVTDADLQAFLSQVIQIEGEPAADGALYRTALAGRLVSGGGELREWLVRNGLGREVRYTVTFDPGDASMPWALDSAEIGGMPAFGGIKTMLWMRLSGELKDALGDRTSAPPSLRLREGEAQIDLGASSPPQG